MKVYNDEKVKEAFSIIVRLLDNMLNNFDDPQKRIFKKTNNAIKAKVMVIKDTVKLMVSIGYVDMDDDCLIYTEEGDKSKVVKAKEILNKAILKLDVNLKEAQLKEEMKKNEDIKKHQEQIKRQSMEEKEKQKKIKESMEKDKEERKKMEKPQDSVSKNLQYGAKVCKFEPKQNERGG